MHVYYYDTADDTAYVHALGKDMDRCSPDPPRSLTARWVPPTMELVEQDDTSSHLKAADFAMFLPSVAVLSLRAITQLRSLVEACGEALPIALSNSRHSYFIFNITLTLDAVDMDRSEFQRFPNGEIMKYKRLVFDRAKIPREPLFFKTTQLGPITEIFATAEAVAAIEQAGLTGYEFRLAGTDQ